VSFSISPTVVRQSLLQTEQGLRIAEGITQSLTLAEPQALDARMVCDLRHLPLKEWPV
jgi:hypothetical protein